MKIKTLILTLFIGLTFGTFPFQANAATKILRLGGTPFYKTKNLQAENVPSIVKKMEKEVKIGFDKAGAADLFTPFMDQVKSAQLEEVQIQPGETLQWMVYKKKNKVLVSQDLIWAGEKPFKAYRFVLQHENKNYEFIFPAVCLNISLKGVSDIPKPAALAPPPPKTEAPAPPPAPLRAEEAKAAPAPPPAPLKVEEVKAAPPPPTPAALPPKVEELKKGFIVFDVAPLVRPDPSIFVLLRGGYMYKFTEKMALTGLIGGALLIRGDNDHSAFLADVIFSFYPTKTFFIGAGAGLWSSSIETNVDAILEAGIHLTPNIAVFLEGRGALNQSFPNERIGAGLRIFF